MGISRTDATADDHVARRLVNAGRLAARACPVYSFRELLLRYADGYRDFTGSELEFDTADPCDGKCLDGAILDDSWLSGSFVGASLRGCSFRRSNVKASDFSHADLRGADFRGAALCGTTFHGAEMEGIKLEDAFFHHARLKSGDVPDW